MIKSILKIILLLIITSNLSAQLPDGTFASAKYIKELLKNKGEEKDLIFDTASVNLNAHLSIAIHIVIDNEGKTDVSVKNLDECIKTTNQLFKPLGISFSATTTYINDYHCGYLSEDSTTLKNIIANADENKINLYLLDSIKSNNVSYYGYTYFPVDSGKNYVFLRKDYALGNNLATMLGHFFGLLSTHEKKSGLEFVNESNCDTTGDLICDTNADPDILKTVNNNCICNGDQTDKNGDYYIPPVANIMSNSRSKCKCAFSVQQYRRMYFYYLKYRQYLR